MTAPLLLTGAILIAIGALWWWREPVSAGYPGSFLVLMGMLFCITAWWLS